MYFSLDFFQKNSFLSISTKISTFRRKIRYFEITLKKSFIGHKRTIFVITMKKLFLVIIRLISTFPPNGRYLRSLKNLIFNKIRSIFEKNSVFLDHFDKSILAHIAEIVKISMKRTFFKDHFATSEFIVNIFDFGPFSISKTLECKK